MSKKTKSDFNISCPTCNNETDGDRDFCHLCGLYIKGIKLKEIVKLENLKCNNLKYLDSMKVLR